MLRTLNEYLEGMAGADPERVDIAATIGALSAAALRLSELIARGPLAGALAAVVGDNAAGDDQKELDVRANQLFLDALRNAPVAVAASEESDSAIPLRPDARLAVAFDPLDGSSNIETNVPLGSIFSIRPADPTATDPDAVFLRPGTEQLAAGFFMYGPQTVLALTVRDGTHIFVFDRAAERFVQIEERAQVRQGKREYAINASNYRHWDPAIRAFIDDCVAGTDGPRGADFNMRWVASLVAEAYRILVRGGVFLYPRDCRPGYQDGRLRLAYEANPIALLIEQAGGAATNATERILELVPESLHQRTPLVFGAEDKVERVRAYCTGRLAVGERSPLFGRRGLFRG